eukprot:scpid98758/ scgid0105/ 
MHVRLQRKGTRKDPTFRLLLSRDKTPDVNADDLAFFYSLETDVSLMAKETRKELLQGVETCWHDYTAAKMGSVCLGLYGSFHGGHRRVATTISATLEVVKVTVRAKNLAISTIKIIVSWKLVKAAEQKLAALAATVSEDADSMSSGSESSSDSDEE